MEMTGSFDDLNMLNGRGPDGSAFAGSAELRERHRALLDPTLPLLATSWQQGRLAFGEHGRFERPQGAGRTGAIELDLRQAEAPSLACLSEHRIAMSYNSASLEVP